MNAINEPTPIASSTDIEVAAELAASDARERVQKIGLVHWKIERARRIAAEHAKDEDDASYLAFLAWCDAR